MFYLLYRHQGYTNPCGHNNGDLYTCEDNMLFSSVKIITFSCEGSPAIRWCLIDIY